MFRSFLLIGLVFLISACAKDEIPKGVSSTTINRGHTCADQTWGAFLASGPQSLDVKPDIKLNGKQVRPVHYGPLKGDRAKVFGFFQLDGKCITKAFTIGSYESTSQLMKSKGNTGSDGRGYHADLYLPDKHVTIGFMRERPTYETALAMARKALN